MKTGIELITEERQRQISQEGWTPQHDDGHKRMELLKASETYLMHVTNQRHYSSPPYGGWPFEIASWKPSDDPIRNLVKSGALIAAEIDRLQRLAARAAGGS
jgi:hypothetical protein